MDYPDRGIERHLCKKLFGQFMRLICHNSSSCRGRNVQECDQHDSKPAALPLLRRLEMTFDEALVYDQPYHQHHHCHHGRLWQS